MILTIIINLLLQFLKKKFEYFSHHFIIGFMLCCASLSISKDEEKMKIGLRKIAYEATSDIRNKDNQKELNSI
jgi:hypothetical protein